MILLPTDIHNIRRSTNNNELPSPRIISNKVIKDSSYKKLPKKIANQLSLRYMQLTSHDIGLRQPYQNGITITKKDF